MRFDGLSHDGASDVGHVVIRLLIEAKSSGKSCRSRLELPSLRTHK